MAFLGLGRGGRACNNSSGAGKVVGAWRMRGCPRVLCAGTFELTVLVVLETLAGQS